MTNFNTTPIISELTTADINVPDNLFAIPLPDFVGGGCLEIRDDTSFYQRFLTASVIGHLNLSEARFLKVLPRTADEAAVGKNVLDSLGEVLEKDIGGNDKSSASSEAEFRKFAFVLCGSLDVDFSCLNNNAYLKYNKFATIRKNGIIDSLPLAQRHFAYRIESLAGAVETAGKSQDKNIRFDEDSLSSSQNVAGHYIGPLSDAEKRISDMITGKCEVYLKNARDMSEALSFIGGATILRLFERQKDGFDLTEKEQRIIEIGRKIAFRMGGLATFKTVAIGRAMWGLHTPTHRTGNDDIPKVTKTVNGA